LFSTPSADSSARAAMAAEVWFQLWETLGFTKRRDLADLDWFEKVITGHDR